MSRARPSRSTTLLFALAASAAAVLADGGQVAWRPGATGDSFDQRWGERRMDLEFPLPIDIGIMEAQDLVAMDAAADGVLAAGQDEFHVPAGTRVTVTLSGGTPAGIDFLVAVGTFPASRLDEADARVAELVQLGYGARLAPWGARLVRGDGAQVHDHRRAFVVVDRATSQEEADAKVREWSGMGFRPFLHEVARAASSAQVQVRIPGGLLYAGPAPVRFRSADGVVRVFDVEYGVGQPWHGRQTRRFHGRVQVAADRRGQLAAVSSLTLEPYLQGVVPSEILPSSPFPALRAQAVAARGETLAKYGLRHAPDPFHLCSEVHCQAYGGITKETARTNQAVAETQGEVMSHSGHIVDAVYAAVCGGHTEHNDFVWSSPPDPALRGSRDGAAAIPSPVQEGDVEAFLADTSSAWCKGGGEKFRWVKRMTATQMRAALAKRDLDVVGRLRDLVPQGRGVSGRLRALKLVGDEGETVIKKELPIRLAFGNLRSALFVTDAERDAAGFLTAVTFRGGGWGHGVGLCQVGARAQAAAGRSYPQILRSYYAGIELVRVDG